MTSMPTRTQPHTHVSTHFMTNAERALYYRSLENYPYTLDLLLDENTRPILVSASFDSAAFNHTFGLTYIIDILRLAVAPETGWRVTHKQALGVEHELWNHGHKPDSAFEPALALLDEIALANGYQFSQNPRNGRVGFRQFDPSLSPKGER